MSEPKICPLNWNPGPSIYDGEFCQADRCAWWVPAPNGGGRCAIQAMGAAAELEL